jgi:hypothetical protein
VVWTIPSKLVHINMCPIFNGCGDNSCLNVTHKKPYKSYVEKTNDILITFIGYVNNLNKLQQFKVSVQKSHNRLQCTFQLSWQQYVSLS